MTKQIIIFSTILVILLVLRLLQKHIRYWAHLLMERGWKSSVHYDRCCRVFTKLYQGTKPFLLSHQERKDKDLLEDASLTYGEVAFYSFVRILELVSPQPGEVFYDIGSGSGKAVFIAGLVFELAKARGIEKLDSLYELSNSLVAKLATLPESKELLPHQKTEISFIHADFVNVDFSDADIVYVSATCFYGPIWDNLMIKLLQLKRGSRVIIVSRKLEIGGYEFKQSPQMLMSWGLATAFIYERI